VFTVSLVHDIDWLGPRVSVDLGGAVVTLDCELLIWPLYVRQFTCFLLRVKDCWYLHRRSAVHIPLHLGMSYSRSQKVLVIADLCSGHLDITSLSALVSVLFR